MEISTQGLIKQLLEAGVHFGHQKNKWNPKMKPYIFAEKNGIYIIDLQKTVEALSAACDFLHDVAAAGGSILFVGTKKQARDIIKEAAAKCGMFYVTERWLGGLLTNFETVKKSVARYDKLETMKADGTLAKLSKKEASQLNKEYLKLKKNLEGVRNMKKLPDAIFIIDPHKEDIAVKESTKLKVPVVALVDTNCNPEYITYIIPGNDDAIRSIKLITGIVLDFVARGREKFAEGRREEAARLEKESEAGGAKEGADADVLVEDAEEIAQRYRRGKKEEKIEEEKTIKHKPAAKRKD